MTTATSTPSTTTPRVESLIRAGIGILPIGGALKLLGNLGTFNSVGYGIPQATEAATVTGPASRSGAPTRVGNPER